METSGRLTNLRFSWRDLASWKERVVFHSNPDVSGGFPSSLEPRQIGLKPINLDLVGPAMPRFPDFSSLYSLFPSLIALAMPGHCKASFKACCSLLPATPASAIQSRILTFYLRGCSLLRNPTFLHLYQIGMKIGLLCYILDHLVCRRHQIHSPIHVVYRLPDPA